MKLIGWKVWYSNGTTYTSKNHKWVDIPINHFQATKKFFDKHTEIQAGLNLYCITDDHDEICNMLKEDYRNVKVGEAFETLEEWKTFFIMIEADKERVTEII